jgi:dCMP deaminase
MKQKWYKMYLDMADIAAEESHAIRLKVGAVFVSPEGVMSIGINGMPAGGDNLCENIIYAHDECDDLPYDGISSAYPYQNVTTGEVYRLETKPEVSHAEENLFGKMLRQGLSSKNGILFLTHQPCINCAKLIRNAGIIEVIYRREYRDRLGVDYLFNNDVICLKEYDATI